MADASRVPVTVLTGFLGSGKTTLLNRILTENHGQRIAVIENEFGEIGIDHALVVNADEEIFEMNNGCICCTVRGDLIRILGNLMRRRDRFDRILIETTGLADPAPVAQTFFVDPEIGGQLRLDGIVTLVDAKHVWLHVDESSECQEQIAFADVIVLNKTDLVPAADVARLEDRIRAMNAMARIHRSQMADVPLERVLEVGGFDLERALATKPTFLEPEYPFEWGGIFELPAGTARLSLAEGPDPEMDLVLLPVAAGSSEALSEAAERAARLFSWDETTVAPGGALRAGEALYRLALTAPGVKSFEVEITEPGLYACFTQHLPEEFDTELHARGVRLEPVYAHVFNPEHEHDETVTSVGIALEGDLDGGRLNRWLQTLLMEKGVDIFRMKGTLAVRGDDRRFVFQGIHMLFEGRPDQPWGDRKRENQLVFIGRNLDREELVAGFRACLA